MIPFKRLIVCILMVICLPGITLSQNGYWFNRADMPTARQEILPGELDGKIYVKVQLADIWKLQ